MASKLPFDSMEHIKNTRKANHRKTQKSYWNLAKAVV